MAEPVVRSHVAVQQLGTVINAMVLGGAHCCALGGVHTRCCQLGRHE